MGKIKDQQQRVRDFGERAEQAYAIFASQVYARAEECGLHPQKALLAFLMASVEQEKALLIKLAMEETSAE